MSLVIEVSALIIDSDVFVGVCPLLVEAETTVSACCKAWAPSTLGTCCVDCPCCFNVTGVGVEDVAGIGGCADADTGMEEKSILNCSGSVGSNCSPIGVNWKVYRGSVVLVFGREGMGSSGLKFRISLGILLTLISWRMSSSCPSGGMGVVWWLVSPGQ